jgi:hypothetical protein
MGVEHTLSVQSSMHFFLTRLPVIVLRRVEEQSLAWIEIMMGAVCLCADGRIILQYFILMSFTSQRTKRFVGILCCLSLSVL